MADEKYEHETREAREQQTRERFDKARQKQAEQDEKVKEREKWKPTPTQEENDLIAMGLPVDKVGHEPDGSKEYPTRTMRPASSDDRKKGYETR